MRPGIDRIQLNGTLREFKRRLCRAEIAEQARVNKMLGIVHLHKAAIARREGGIFPDGIAEDGDRALPAFRIEFHHEILPAQPAVAQIGRNPWFAGAPPQKPPYGGRTRH